MFVSNDTLYDVQRPQAEGVTLSRWAIQPKVWPVDDTVLLHCTFNDVAGSDPGW